MAKYKSIVITSTGLSLVAAAHSGDTIKFTAIKTGNGVYDGTETLEDMTDLKSIQQIFGITGITREDTVVKVRSVLSNEGVTEGYYQTEIGLYALKPETETEILYAIIVADSDMADYFSPYTEFPQSMTLEAYISAIGVEEGVMFTASILEDTYATVQDFEEHRNENAEAHNEINEKLNSVEESSNNHIDDTNNPHKITKEQIGLGYVPNVDTNNQTPTYTETSTNTALTSGEKLSVAFGKIAKAISSLISHLANKSNPHGVTKAQIGLGNVDNTTDADKPVSTAQQSAIDLAYYNSNLYTDTKINELVNGAPSTLDTLKEIADAMAENDDVVQALEDAVGSKANESEFTSHVNNVSNPHGVTKAQVGLGNVPNVSTNNQTPTYTAATSNTALTSGEKLSVAFGKIAKAISSLISHLANTSNPHSVTKAQIGLSNVDNTTDADKPVSTAQQSAIDLISIPANLTSGMSGMTAYLTGKIATLTFNGGANLNINMGTQGYGFQITNSTFNTCCMPKKTPWKFECILYNSSDDKFYPAIGMITQGNGAVIVQAVPIVDGVLTPKAGALHGSVSYPVN